MLPVRPNPVMTSSTMKRTSCFLSTGWIEKPTNDTACGPARAEHGFGDERSDGVGSLVEDQLLQFVRHAGRERFLGFPVPRVVIIMGTGRVQDVGDGRVEILVGIGKPGETRRRQGDAVIRASPGDDFFLLRTAADIVVIPDDLDLGVVGFRPRVGKKHLGHGRRRNINELFRQIDDRGGRLMRKRVVGREFLQLPNRRLDQPLLAKPERGAPESGQSFDIALAFVVADVDAVALLDYERSAFLVGRKVGVRVEVVGDIPRSGRVRVNFHRALFLIMLFTVSGIFTSTRCAIEALR